MRISDPETGQPFDFCHKCFETYQFMNVGAINRHLNNKEFFDTLGSEEHHLYTNEDECEICGAGLVGEV